MKNRKRRIDKRELATMKVLAEMGETPSAIAKQIGKSHHTTICYLKEKTEVFNDPEVKKLIEVIKQKELDELCLIGKKSRTVLNNYLDDCLAGEKQPNPIAIVAIQDRSFQQRRLLENEATQIFDISRHAELEVKAKKLAERIIELKKNRGERGRARRGTVVK